MAKLIGHYFDKKKCEFILFEINNLKESAKQFLKIKGTTNSFPGFSPDYWIILPKSQIDELRAEWSGMLMYSLKENMTHFRELVIANLESNVEFKKEEYTEAMLLLRSAFNAEIPKLQEVNNA